MRKILRILGWLVLAGVVLVGGFAAYVFFNRNVDRITLIDDWFEDPPAYPDWFVTGGEYCPGAPMMFPSDGFIGVGWNDGAPPMYQHTGYDIFSPEGISADNITPIYAAYDGYLTRENDWRSAVIIRHPDFDELPEITGGEQIWTYYTHMASADGETSYIEPDFPRGTQDMFVEAGTLLGYQGTWSGRPSPIALHLHFSVVKTTVSGGFENETIIANTYDPGPFLGIVEYEDGLLRCQPK